MIEASKLLVLDGGMSRELKRLNAPFRQPEWSALALMERPEVVLEVHRQFIEAGADVITTNSYALVPFHIGEERFSREGARLIALSGSLARAAANEEFEKNGRRVLVAGSLPPVFGSYRPDLFDESKIDGYLEIFVEALTPYVDIWLGETLSLAAESAAIQRAVHVSDKPIWISFTLDDEARTIKSESSLRSGEGIEAAIDSLTHNMITALLFNCSQPEVMSAALNTARTILDSKKRKIMLGVYANAFKAVTGTRNANADISAIRDDLSPVEYVSYVQEWIGLGAAIVGGCCGVGCDHIRMLAAKVK